MAENLTPCPFCGGQAVAYKSGSATAAGDDWDVECSECLVTVHGIHGTGKEAFARWNRRVPDAEMVEALTTVLPYIEAAEEDEAYKPGAVRKVTELVRAALSRATGEQPDTSTEPRP